MREIKFRAWDKESKDMLSDVSLWNDDFTNYLNEHIDYLKDKCELMQFTGLKDKQGVEIYEFMEIDKVWEVQYSNGSYILINISSDDIITLYKYMEQRDGQITVTKEYTKI